MLVSSQPAIRAEFGIVRIRGDAESGWIKTLPGFMAPGPVAGWLQERDLPKPAAKSIAAGK